MKYRADIDGLRAVAVLLVVYFHAALPSLPGGFIGVDVFFVISGYLITSLIVLDLQGPGFSIAHFYERRIRRIFPALIVVLIASLVIGYAVLMPDRFADLGRSVVSVCLFVSNILFWKSVSYFNPNADAHVLLHTWSLAVEEQYYVFYPLLLVFLYRRPKSVRPVLVAITFASLVLSIVLVASKPSAAFYLLPTRAWELLVGGLVALEPRSNRLGSKPGLTLGIAGLLMILVPALAYDASTPFPGLAALPPVLGAAVVIWCGTGNGTAMNRMLAARPVVFVGTISYALYLWHFPLLAFARYLGGGALRPQPAIVACALAFGAAIASLYLVERPFRRHGLRPAMRRVAIGLPAVGMAGLAALGLVIVRGEGLPNRLSAAQARIAWATDDEHRHHRECMSVGNVIVPPARACRLGDSVARPTAILWGDSHAMVTATAMEFAARRQHASFLFSATADCPIGLGFSISMKTARTLTTTPSYRYCASYNQAMLDRALADPSLRHVVLSSRWSNWRIGEPPGASEDPVDLRLEDESGVADTRDRKLAMYRRGFFALLRRLTEAGKQVHIVGPVPEPPANFPEALYAAQFGLAPPVADLTYRDYLERHAAILAMFRTARSAYPVHFIMPVVALCDRHGHCPVSREGVPQYLDHNHLSVATAQRTAPLYAAIFARDR